MAQEIAVLLILLDGFPNLDSQSHHVSSLNLLLNLRLLLLPALMLLLLSAFMLVLPFALIIFWHKLPHRCLLWWHGQLLFRKLLLKLFFGWLLTL
jgi:hypothetical protein